MKFFHIGLVSALGAGLIPFAPGTWGTLVGTIILAILWKLGLLVNPWVLIGLTVIFTGIGLWSIKSLPDTWIHDDQRIVIDEVVGLWAAMIFIPISIQTIVLSFVLFRLFDIFKPLGIRYFDRLKSDFGVIVDDLLAGVYANVTIRIVMLALSAYDL